VPLWLFLVYVPIFKWVYGGWLGQRGSLDFAGGTAIHVNAGIAALAAVFVLGRRRVDPAPPHSVPLVMIGTGILWFGWFGFNAGSALNANGQAAQAFMNTFLAGAAGMDVDRVDSRWSANEPWCGIWHRRGTRRNHPSCWLCFGNRPNRHRANRWSRVLLRSATQDKTQV
jgi:hypothetical protein